MSSCQSAWVESLKMGCGAQERSSQGGKEGVSGVGLEAKQGCSGVMNKIFSEVGAEEKGSLLAQLQKKTGQAKFRRPKREAEFGGGGTSQEAPGVR